MNKMRLFLYFFFILILLIYISPAFNFAEEQSDSRRIELEKQIAEYQNKLEELNQQKNTLTSQIQYMDAQIKITTLKIQKTEQDIQETQKEIGILNSRIESLDNSLDYLSKLLLQRVVEGYKKRSVSILSILLDSTNARDFLSQIKYIKSAQENNQKILVQVQGTKVNFEEQKKLREEKKTELDNLNNLLNKQKINLDTQKIAKQKLLEVTKNDEKSYQNLLDKAKSEYLAIQAIVAGAGTESKIKEVKKGETIATVIVGASCNSSGGHLHFIVKENGNVVNPFSYLKSVDSRNCSGSSCDSGDGDAFNPTGTWDWPLIPPIELSQGYGSTWAVRNTWVGRVYNFHNGIDINGSSSNVQAVADGELYRGSFSGSGGCALPYVKLMHKETNFISYYLHVYSQ